MSFLRILQGPVCNQWLEVVSGWRWSVVGGGQWLEGFSG